MSVPGLDSLELRAGDDSLGVLPVVLRQGLLLLSGCGLDLPLQVLLVVMPVGAVSHFLPVYGGPTHPVLYSSQPFLLQRLQRLLAENAELAFFFGHLQNLGGLFLLRRLTDLPKIVELVWGKILQIEFGVPEVGHVLLGTLLAREMSEAEEAIACLDFLQHFIDESLEIDALVAEGREGVVLGEMGLGELCGTEGTSLRVGKLLVDEFELRKGGRLAFVLEEGLAVGLVLVGVYVLLVGLRGHELLGADLAVDFGVALALRRHLALELCVDKRVRRL